MEKGILFSTDMVKAILEGRKTTTRRIVKPQPDSKHQSPLGYVIGGCKQDHEGYFGWGIDEYGGNIQYAKPPYQVGDILYVRETWAENWTHEQEKHYINTTKPYVYKTDKGVFVGKWHPSIHMPKAAARIFLKVTDVKAEQIRAISAGECVKEGIKLDYPITDIYSADEYIEEFKKLWDNCYNWPKSWDANPWVWVIEFERIK